jgi:hypothetical protein
MKNSLLAVSLLLTSVVRASAAPSYSGVFQSHATAYTGESYTRDFKIGVEFFPKNDPSSPATVRDASYCRFPDEPSLDCVKPADFDPYCETGADFDLGSVQVTITDLESGETQSRSYPWRAHAAKSEPKGAGVCAPARLAGSTISGEINANFKLKSVKAGTERDLTVSVDAYAGGIEQSDLAMVTTLLPAGPDAYRAAPWTVRPAAKIWWSYYHEVKDALTWGTTGFATITQQ